MKLNTDRLKAFYQVALDKHFCNAADALFITQSALSQRILKLEQELGTSLLTRGTEGVGLTKQGEILFDYVSNLKHQEQEVLNQITGKSAMANGIMKIGAFSSVMRSVIMPSLLPLINSSHQLKAEFFSRELRELPPLLLSGEVDYVVVDEKIHDPRVENTVLGQETLVHIRNKATDTNQPPCFLDHDVYDQTTYNYFAQQNLADYEFDRCFYDDVYGLLDGVRMGFGEAVVSKHMVREDDVIEVIPHDVEVKSDVILCYLKKRFESHLHKEIVTHLQSNVPGFL